MREDMVERCFIAIAHFAEHRSAMPDDGLGVIAGAAWPDQQSLATSGLSYCPALMA
jgi:hypothetical protein